MIFPSHEFLILNAMVSKCTCIHFGEFQTIVSIKCLKCLFYIWWLG